MEAPGKRIKRLIEGGIKVSACRRSPSLTLSSSRTKPNPRLAIKGNGCAGSIASGVSTGKTSAMNWLSSQARSLGVEAVRLDDQHARFVEQPP